MSQVIAERLWWVAFTDIAKPCWLNRYLARGFRHCWAFTEITPCTVLAFNPALDHCQIVHQDKWPHELICEIEAADPMGRVVAFDQVSIFPPPIGRASRRGISVTCASYLAYTLGLDGTINTPYRLYRDLMAGGGRLVAGVGSNL